MIKRKIKLTEQDLYNIVERVMLEQKRGRNPLKEALKKRVADDDDDEDDPNAKDRDIPEKDIHYTHDKKGMSAKSVDDSDHDARLDEIVAAAEKLRDMVEQFEEDFDLDFDYSEVPPRSNTSDVVHMGHSVLDNLNKFIHELQDNKMGKAPKSPKEPKAMRPAKRMTPDKLKSFKEKNMKKD